MAAFKKKKNEKKRIFWQAAKYAMHAPVKYSQGAVTLAAPWYSYYSKQR